MKFGGTMSLSLLAVCMETVTMVTHGAVTSAVRMRSTVTTKLG